LTAVHGRLPVDVGAETSPRDSAEILGFSGRPTLTCDFLFEPSLYLRLRLVTHL